MAGQFCGDFDIVVRLLCICADCSSFSKECSSLAGNDGDYIKTSLVNPNQDGLEPTERFSRIHPLDL